VRLAWSRPAAVGCAVTPDDVDSLIVKRMTNECICRQARSSCAGGRVHLARPRTLSFATVVGSGALCVTTALPVVGPLTAGDPSRERVPDLTCGPVAIFAWCGHAALPGDGAGRSLPYPARHYVTVEHVRPTPSRATRSSAAERSLDTRRGGSVAVGAGLVLDRRVDGRHRGRPPGSGAVLAGGTSLRLASVAATSGSSTAPRGAATGDGPTIGTGTGSEVSTVGTSDGVSRAGRRESGPPARARGSRPGS
jgi:hypothetical protein